MASYNSAQAFRIARHMTNPNGVNAEAITDSKTLTYKDSECQILTLTAAGAKDLNLPVFKNGASFWVTSASTSNQDIVVKDQAAATIATLSAGAGVRVVCDGSAWYVIKA